MNWNRILHLVAFPLKALWYIAVFVLLSPYLLVEFVRGTVVGCGPRDPDRRSRAVASGEARGRSPEMIAIRSARSIWP